MKILILAVAISGLLVGCASDDYDSNRGGTSDDNFHNNATQGTGSSAATNQNSGNMSQ
jgi:hypothetical protein